MAVAKSGKKKSRAAEEEEDPLVHSVSDYGDDEFDFDLAKVPKGKVLEPDDPEAPPELKKKAKKESGEDKPKKKKKKQDDEEAGNPLVIGVFVLVGLCSLGTIGYFGFQKIGGGVAAGAPLEKKFKTFKHEVAGWSLEVPEDWKLQSSGGSGGSPPLVLLEGDGAIFRMKGSTGGSMIGSIAQAGGGAGIAVPGQDAVGGADDLSPETAVHEFQKELFKQDYKDFEEEDAKKITTKFGEGRISIFTASEGFFKPKIKGYRATFLDTNYQYNIRAYVPESQWDQFQPTFRKMIDSLSR